VINGALHILQRATREALLCDTKAPVVGHATQSRRQTDLMGGVNSISHEMVFPPPKP
jgi:hypothetical protein